MEKISIRNLNYTNITSDKTKLKRDCVSHRATIIDNFIALHKNYINWKNKNLTRYRLIYKIEIH